MFSVRTAIFQLLARDLCAHIVNLLICVRHAKRIAKLTIVFTCSYNFILNMIDFMGLEFANILILHLVITLFTLVVLFAQLQIQRPLPDECRIPQLFSTSMYSAKELAAEKRETTQAVVDGTIAHPDTVCVHCGNGRPIIGSRFKCMVCPNVDICAACEAANAHDRSHILLKVWNNR